MKLSDYLSEECVLVNPQVTDKTSILKVIAETARKSPVLSSRSVDEIFSKLSEREKLGSTGFGNEIAIPHCSLDGISDFVVGIITLKDGIDFDSLDRKKTRLFVFIIAPSDKRKMHIRYLSSISGVLRIPEAVTEILAGNNAMVVRESFLRYTSEKQVDKAKKDFNILHIFVQSEDKFEDVLSILTEVSETNISVLEANNAGKFLHALPLFSSFWNEKKKGFHRLIIATIEKSLTNDVLRKINLLIDSLEDKTGMMVLMQNIVYLNGSIDI